MSVINESKSGVEYLTVNSSFGSVKGFVNKDYPNVAQFLGIRFAEPPRGALRWLPPVPKTPAGPAETIDATAFSPSCPQWTGGPAVVYNTVCTEFNIRGETDEDCLSVSIWTPEKAAKKSAEYKLPVIVWITGGAFVIGGSTVPYQNPTPWVDSSKRHIVVCVNYRLGIFGFPGAGGLKPDEQNLGILDQRLGLEWVHKHISSFGGDPDRITHFGQSAGAKSVDAHLFAFPDKPLLKGAILHSGTALLPLPPRRNTDFGHYSFVAKKLGFEGDDPLAELEFMRQQSAQTLLDAIAAHFWTREQPFLNFRPVVDGVTIFEDYEGLAKCGSFAHLVSIDV
ncbi:hypothetical protein SLS53_008189 [Cytospora paraplurivora]|uniref:Carboxylesterase type B domain-containing protein n=1 Tax=Cytospora paraplurivora TaxID=2898453 RepID=A0AAN9YD70_9PEZI